MATTFNHFPQIASALDDILGQVVRKTAFDLQGNMQAQIRANKQIDTSFMINSVYVRTSEESTYGNIQTPPPGVTPFPEVERPPDKHTAFIAVAAPYGYWQNYGTRFQPARPFVEPSVETTRPSFDEAVSRVEEALRRAS